MAADSVFERAIDELCNQTGLKRAGPLTSVDKWGDKDPQYVVHVRLRMGRSIRRFEVNLGSNRRVLSFAPDRLDLSHLPQGLGYNEITNPDERARCIAPALNVARFLECSVYGHAAIQRMRGTFVVTYETLPREILKANLILDPYVSFVVTRDGTVCAVFFGA